MNEVHLTEHLALPHPAPLLADTEFDLRGLAWNPLCDPAMPLIGLVIRLRSLDQHDDVSALYQGVHNQITTIMEELKPLDYDPGALKAYSYSLCLLLDEVVMSTPWGRHSQWSQRSLLSAFHHETWGGEKFFTLLTRMATDVAHYQHVLEFMYLCLCAGLKGKYGNQVSGDEQVQRVINHLHGLLRPLRGVAPTPLTEPLTHVAPSHYRIKRAWPLWTPWAMAGGVLIVAYTVYAVRLHDVTRQVLVSLDHLLTL